MKKLFCLIIAVFTALALVPTASASTYNVYFRDVQPTHWAYGYVTYAAAQGLIVGFNDGTFAPDGTLTEAQCAQIVYNCLGRNYNYGNQYNYNNYSNQYNYGGYWYSDAVSFVERNSNIRISPNQTATRSFVCVLIFEFTNNGRGSTYYGDQGSYYGYNSYSYYTRFSDCCQLPAATQQAISWCQTNGIVNGFQDGTFRPYDTLTRAQGAKVFSLTHQIFWQYGGGGSYYYGDSAASMLTYAESLYLTADLEDTSTRNEYRETLTVYGRNSQKYVYVFRGQWYEGNNTVTSDYVRNQIRNIANGMTQKELCQVACQVTGNYAKDLGWRITDIGEWPSYDKTRGIYWHRLKISNSRTTLEFLCGGETYYKEVNWFIVESGNNNYYNSNGVRAMNSREEVKDLIRNWSY